MKNIYLIGMPGSGKSAIGGLLSERLGYTFCDMDSMIEDERRETAATVIVNYGESYFRDIEAELLERISEMKSVVCATGGGIVTKKSNYDCIKKNSVVIYIIRELGKLPYEGRPVSQRRSVEALYKERHERYEDWSDFSVLNNDIEETVRNIMNRLTEYAI